MIATHGGNIKQISEDYQIPEGLLLDFSANINPLGVSDIVKKAITEQFDSVQHYPDLRYKALKQTIATHHTCQSHHIFLGNGAADIIYSLPRVLSTTKMLVLAPTFSEYEDAFSVYDVDVVYFETAYTGFNVKMDDFINCIQTECVDTVCVCNPNNPTGTLIEPSEMNKLVNYCKKEQIHLIVDEAFMDFLPKSQSIDGLITDYANLYIIRSLTKIFAIPGIRLGYLLTSNQKVIDSLEKQAPPWRINCFAELAGRLSLTDDSQLLASIAFIQQEREYLMKQLSRFQSLKVIESSGNYLFFEYLDEGNLQELLLEHSILIRDCSNYKGLTGKYFRVAVRTHEENKRLITGLEETLNGDSDR